MIIIILAAIGIGAIVVDTGKDYNINSKVIVCDTNNICVDTTDGVTRR